MTQEQFAHLQDGTLIVITQEYKSKHLRLLRVFKSARRSCNNNWYAENGFVYNPEELSLATEEDYNTLVAREERRHKNVLRKLKRGYKQTQETDSNENIPEISSR